MIVFNIAGELHGVFSSLPSESYLDESKWVIAELAEGEVFDSDYNYSSVDGVALKGALIPVDSVEIARIAAEWAAQEYARNRQAEYPSLLELVVALYDTDDKAAVEAKRAAVKTKFPK